MKKKNADLIHNDALKMPPHSVEAEQGVLGALMLSDAAFDIVSDIIGENDFFRPAHRMLYAAISALANQNKPCDIITLSDHLKQNDQLEAAGGMIYIGSLAKDTPSAANAKAYAQIVRERAILRSIIVECDEIANLAYNPGQAPVSEILDTAQSKLIDLSDNKRSSEPVRIGSVLSDALGRIDHKFMNADQPIGLKSGFRDLDEKILALEAGDLIILAGRPSMGKSTVAVNMAEHAAIRCGKTALIFSLEMRTDQLTDRVLSNMADVNHWAIRNGKLAQSDWPKLTSATSMLSKSPLYIDDTAAITLQQIRARARRVKREHGLGLLIVDYLQLMGLSTKFRDNRANEVSELSRGLKSIAKELNVPVVALSQLNRSLEQRHDKRPIMSDLRDSGAIEQDADLIIFVYRDEVYNENSKYKGTAELIIAKQRNGPTGRVSVKNELYRCRFVDLNQDEEHGYDKKGGTDD